MEEVIANQRHVKLEENQEADLITKKAILKVNWGKKIRGMYRVICEFSEKPIGIELRKKQEIEIEWELLGERRRIDLIKLVN